MHPATDTITKLTESFEHIQQLLETIRASEQTILDGYVRQGLSEVKALKAFYEDLKRIENTADLTLREIKVIATKLER